MNDSFKVTREVQSDGTIKLGYSSYGKQLVKSVILGVVLAMLLGPFFELTRMLPEYMAYVAFFAPFLYVIAGVYAVFKTARARKQFLISVTPKFAIEAMGRNVPAGNTRRIAVHEEGGFKGYYVGATVNGQVVRLTHHVHEDYAREICSSLQSALGKGLV